jgi:hypothetical protein
MMSVVPELTPVITPELPAVEVAMLVLPLIHVPPAIALLNVVVDPAHIVVNPVIPGGVGFTVIVVVTVLPETEYDITLKPAATPVTTPVPVPTVAAAVLLLIQVPPAVASLSLIVDPAQTADGPVMGAATTPGLTVKLFLFTLKNILPVPFTFILAAVTIAPGFGMVTLAVPLFGKVPNASGQVYPPSLDMYISTFAALTGAAIVPTTFHVTVCVVPPVYTIPVVPWLVTLKP